MIRRVLALGLLLLSLARSQEEAQKLDVGYVVDATKPDEGTVHVTMQIRHYDGKSVELSMPCWRPGAYRLQNDYKNVKDLSANGSGNFEIETVNEMTWRVKSDGSRDITVEYNVTIPKVSRERDQDRFNKDHFFFEGPSLYLYIVDHKEAPCHVEFKMPEGWKAGTGLTSKGGVYFARDYDTFIDCPTELGKFELLEFEQDGAKYQIVVHATGEIDGPGMIDVHKKIVKEHNSMFGGVPFDRYVFIYHLRGSPGGGGLEHLNSTNISFYYPAVKRSPLSLASMTSHEYFHLWNVKRIRPKELGPFDYAKAVRSPHLWLCEGVTSYFGDRALPRTGIYTEERYFGHLAGEMMTLQNEPDRKVTSVERSAEKIWENLTFRGVNYYNKGELLGLLLDLKIRTLTGNEKCLDDVMRYLYDTNVVQPSKKGKGPIGVGFEADGILKALNTVSGHDFEDFYKKYIRGLEELPFEEVLGAAGLEVKIQVGRTVELPVSLRGITITEVPEGSEAAKAGLKAGDRISAIDGHEVTRDTFGETVRKLKPDSEVTLTVLRGQDSPPEKVEVKLKARTREGRTTCSIKRKADATELQTKILDGWLKK